MLLGNLVCFVHTTLYDYVEKLTTEGLQEFYDIIRVCGHSPWANVTPPSECGTKAGWWWSRRERHQHLDQTAWKVWSITVLTPKEDSFNISKVSGITLLNMEGKTFWVIAKCLISHHLANQSTSCQCWISWFPRLCWALSNKVGANPSIEMK